jgi:hypothetical protein
MKKILTLVAALFILAATNQAQTLQSLFDKYGNDERFEYVSVGAGMMNLASAFGGMAKNEKQMTSKMRGIKILTLNQSSNTQLMKSVVHDLDQIVEKGNFETAVEARDKGERVHIYYRVTGKDNADMLIITKDQSELSLIWITGKMSKEEMMKSFSSNGKILEQLVKNEKSEIENA